MPDKVPGELESSPLDPSEEKVDVTPAPAKASEAEQLAAKIKSDFEALYGSRLKQTEDRLHGAYRINERLQKEVEQLKQQVTTPRASASPSPDPWAGIENGAVWKSEVEKLAEQKAEEKLKSWQAQQQTEAALKQQQTTLEHSKHAVVSKYPDLDPETGTTESLVAKTYLTVLNEHPDWLTNPYGPQLAMYAMEERLKTPNGNGKPGTIKSSTVATASLAPSRSTSSPPERIVLTREQKQLCDRQGWKYEEYARIAASLDQGQGAVEA